MPVLAITSRVEHWPLFTFDQNWHHLCLNFAVGKDLSNDTQIRMIAGQLSLKYSFNENAQKFE